ncbi:hypothetical protein [Calycomorphotria hydatis]|uniref:Uncharacterized protein n=1 Tax=Calycomorphotria hydatis TaxID=2528027 RepID=A0A517TEC7_9PLAN|nr:hypothetical protein [Calycomorphotria hydatis]QDT66723.1 hypothetical protein V22_39940 [Calycomorphotria hydatis]
MKQNDLNRSVARATGESVTTVKRLGFLLAEPDEVLDPDDEALGPQVIDWDEFPSAQIHHPEVMRHAAVLV